MSFTDSQRFLLAADIIARGHDYFQWRVVARMLRWPDNRCKRALQALDANRLLLLLHGEEAKLLAAGRTAARELTARVPAGGRALRTMLFAGE